MPHLKGFFNRKASGHPDRVMTGSPVPRDKMMRHPFSSPTRLTARLGFDVPKLRQSLWVVLVAFLALALAWGLGLDHPQWAAITVFVTIQPSRGQTIEKNIYRFIGTIAGSVFGLVLLTVAGPDPLAIAIGLAIWSGLCLFVGTLQRSFRSYGTVLAGYSAIIVAMNNTGPVDMVKWVALDRVSAIFIGLVAGIALSYMIARRSNRRELELKTRRIVADMLGQAAANLARDGLAKPLRNYQLCAAAAELSTEMATLASRRAGAHQLTDPLNDLLVCATNLMLAAARAKAAPGLAEQIAELAAKLHQQSDFTGGHRALTRSIARCDDPMLEDAILALAAAMPDEEGEDRGLTLAPTEGLNWNYDWRSAAQAGARIAIVTGAIGLVWYATGAAIVQFALISAAIVVSLASSGVSPSRAMRDVVIGQLIAACAALTCEMGLWQLGLDGAWQVVAMLPFLLLFAFIRSHRRLSLSATDYALTLILLLTPSHEVYVAHYPPIDKAALAASGGIIGYIAFRFLFPVSATRRRKALWVMIKRELQEIATAAPGRAGSANGWRLRFVTRFLKIVSWTFHEAQAGERPEITMRKGLLTLALGDLVFGCRTLLRQEDLPLELRRAAMILLRRIGASDRENPRLARALTRLGERLKVCVTPPSGPDAVEGEAVAVSELSIAARRILDLCAELHAQLDDLQALRGAPLGAHEDSAKPEAGAIAPLRG